MSTKGKGKPLHGETEASACDGQSLQQALASGTAWLEKHVAVINSLNVFPVPDGDTGTNMLLTMQAAMREVSNSAKRSVSAVAQAIAQGALMGARGNSGVILSQLLRGFADSLEGKVSFEARDLAKAMAAASSTAYQGVLKPVEGTILTVAREAAEAAAAVESDLGQMLSIIVEEAQASLERTPNLLPVLKDAGVVDAGGKGLYIILEGALRFLRGEAIDETAVLVGVATVETPSEGEYGYDTQFLLRGSGLNMEEVRTRIDSFGDSTLVVGDRKLIKVHVHTENPGSVLDYAIKLGSLSEIIIENMQDQYQEFIAAKGSSPETSRAMESTPLGSGIQVPNATDVALVAVAPGGGLQRVFESLGVNFVVKGGQTMNPSIEELLYAIEVVPKSQVIILPNNRNVILTAQQAKGLAKKEVFVIPTKTVPQGISAVLALNYQATVDTNLKSMWRAAESIQTTEITTAVRSARINELPVEKGDFIGLLNGDLLTKGSRLQGVAQEMLVRMGAEDCDIITLYHGEDMSPQEAESLAQMIREKYPGPEVEVVDGGQPHYHCIISAE